MPLPTYEEALRQIAQGPPEQWAPKLHQLIEKFTTWWEHQTPPVTHAVLSNVGWLTWREVPAALISRWWLGGPLNTEQLRTLWWSAMLYLGNCIVRRHPVIVSLKSPAWPLLYVADPKEFPPREVRTPPWVICKDHPTVTCHRCAQDIQALLVLDDLYSHPGHPTCHTCRRALLSYITAGGLKKPTKKAWRVARRASF